MNRKNSQSQVSAEARGRAAVAELKGNTHKFYEDRYRMLSSKIDLVRTADRGEIFAVFDGVGGAPMGMRAAQHMADALLEFFTEPENWDSSQESLEALIREASGAIRDWGLIEGTTRPLGAAAGTIVWLIDGDAILFHAGDTEAWLSVGDAFSPIIETDPGDTVVQYFGRGRDLDLTITEVPLDEGDRLILFSDGLRKCVYPSMLEKAFRSADRPINVARALVEEGERIGAPDDVTLMVIDGGDEQ